MSEERKMTVTRFAPSPTGRLHLGNLRTALYAWLAARHDGGRFLLRIEDTDRERGSEEYVENIIETLRAYGLSWDGEPVLQSGRLERHQDVAIELFRKGGCYLCFCPKGSDKPCRCGEMKRDEVRELLFSDAPFTVRQRIPEGEITAEDKIFGEVSARGEDLDDQILIKSDEWPTYNFAHVVDDHDMGITKVIRGSEFLSSLPKYALLYKALGWDMPENYHCPGVTGKGGAKLSKRDGAVPALDYIEKEGFLPEAVLNYLFLLGQPAPEGGGIMDIGEMTERFDISRISKSPAVFDRDKMVSVNREHLRLMDGEEYLRRARPWLGKIRSADDSKLLLGLKTRIDTFADIPEMASFVNTWKAPPPEMYNNKRLRTDPRVAKALLGKLAGLLAKIPGRAFTEEAVLGRAEALAKAAGVKRGQVLFPLTVALTGAPSAPGGGAWIAAVLGKEKTLERLSGI